MKMKKPLLLALLSTLALAFLVHAQDQSGFISIDCGIPKGSDYTDSTNEINYVSDATFIDSELGLSNTIASSYLTISGMQKRFHTLRSFPNGTKNCYTLKPSRLLSKYLIRASFMYGNYDGLNTLPTFDIQLGVETWDTVEFVGMSSIVRKEIIHMPTSNYTYICLLNTGLGTPFISAIEFRPLNNDSYVAESGSLNLYVRWNYGSSVLGYVAYPYDVYDRYWPAYEGAGNMGIINTTNTVDSNSYNVFQPPSLVMRTAVTPINETAPISFYWVPDNATTQFYVYVHFAEVEVLTANQTRQFDIMLNGSLWYDKNLSPVYLSSTTVYSQGPMSKPKFDFKLVRTATSTLPPLLNAMEIYNVKNFSQSPTVQDEVDAMKNMKTTYGVKSNWQGDPCTPELYAWTGLACSYDGYNPPHIISLNLSSSGLTGEIPSSIADLQSLQILDLSNNSLNGAVPDFLAQLPSLKVLDLKGNNLTGSIPSALLQRSKSGSLTLSVDDNLLSTSTSQKKHTSSIVVPVVAGVVGGLVFIIALVLLLVCLLVKKQKKENKVATTTSSYMAPSCSADDESILVETKNRQFTYDEVLNMTNDFQKILGSGGFGSVFLGNIQGTQVAVKILSLSSVHGNKQFRAEVKLLMRVHHRNLTSLVGLCDEGEHKALIYEYMVKGNLDDNIKAKGSTVLNWEERLRIAVDSALGLEYLHTGCKPPIVHRDVKSTNILLNETFQAKIADFGLSRVFPSEGGTHVSTVVAGTPGYLDPEYYISNRLNEKSDVFSFGVVILELITGRVVISRDQDRPHISQWVAYMLETEGDIEKIVDPRLYGEFDANSVWKAIEIAMACVSATGNHRPTMTQVVIELKECLAMEMARTNGDSLAAISTTTDPIEMASLNVDTRLTPIAR